MRKLFLCILVIAFELQPSCPGIPAYNASSRISTECSQSLWSDISLIYWQPFQDNMEIGLALESVSPIFSGPTLIAVSTNQSKYVIMDFDFMPGFKIGMGTNFSHDSWDGSLEYTRLHGKDLKYSNGGAFGLAPAFADSSMLLLLGTSVLPYGPGKASWKIKLDFLDADLSRWHYSGTQFILHPFFGIRAAWIRQQLHGAYWNPIDGVLNTLNITSTLASWGIGPRTGLDGQWILGRGIRFYGNTEADLLYTRYHWNYKSVLITPSLLDTPNTFTSKEDGIDTIRAHIDLELGLGWGSYFYRNKWHIDLSAGYTFQVFFNQNMFKFYFTTSDLPFNYAPVSNLYIQGMTVKTKFDF